MSDMKLCRDCRHVIAPRRWFGLAEPNWAEAKCAKSIRSWVSTTSGATHHSEPDKCFWERNGGALRKPGGCGPEARFFSPLLAVEEGGI